MSRFIRYQDDQTGETVYVNVSSVSEARFDPKLDKLELTFGDPAGQSHSTQIMGREAHTAKAVLDNLCK